MLSSHLPQSAAWSLLCLGSVYKYLKQIVNLGLQSPGSTGPGEETQSAETYTVMIKRGEEETSIGKEIYETDSSQCPFMVVSNNSYQKYASHQVQGRGSQSVRRPGRDFQYFMEKDSTLLPG